MAVTEAEYDAIVARYPSVAARRSCDTTPQLFRSPPEIRRQMLACARRWGRAIVP